MAGWAHRRRDHGGVIFVDLRDREGLLQIVFDPDTPEVFAMAERVRNEFVLKVTGAVRVRPSGTANPHLKSGQVEVLCRALEILNRSEPLPFQLDEHVSEEVRLRFRYIDLRREEMRERLLLRHRITRAMRQYLDEAGFVDIETPMLSKATPEGARDYLVPSRTHPGKFFALPQSPQIYKQLLMISGFDRYYQIVRCFRDEDLRADRQPEFTQLDIETSFLDQAQIQELMEGLVRFLFKQVLGVELPNPVPRMTYSEAMRRFGSDKPDLRIALEFVDVADLVQGCDFKVFAGPAADPRGRVAALRVPQGGRLTRKEIDDYTAYVARFGAKGLAYIKVNDVAKGRDGLQSPILKFLSDAAIAGILERTSASDGDLIFFGADTGKVVSDALRGAAPEGRPGPQAGGLRVASAVGRRFSDVRVGSRGEALGGHASSVHQPGESGLRRACRKSGRGDRQSLRPGAERLGDRRRFGAYSHPGAAVRRVRPVGHIARGGAAQVRLPAGRAQVRCAAPWRHRFRSRPAGDAHGGRRQHSRRDCVSEDADRRRSVDGCAHRGERGAAQGIAHPPARAAEGRVAWLQPFRRPESVLIVIYTAGGEFLLLERRKPPGFWQSVTGSLEWGETADAAARRELIEETGITQGFLRNLHWAQVYEILPSFGKKYAPGVTRNLEHAFALKLPERVPVTLSETEHVQYRWVPAAEALALASSSTNRAVIQQLRR